MAQAHFSDPVHRLENYSRGEFFGAYAYIRHAVSLASSGPEGIRWLRRLTAELDKELSERLDVTGTSLAGALHDRAERMILIKDAEDEGGSATG